MGNGVEADRPLIARLCGHAVVTVVADEAVLPGLPWYGHLAETLHTQGFSQSGGTSDFVPNGSHLWGTRGREFGSPEPDEASGDRQIPRDQWDRSFCQRPDDFGVLGLVYRPGQCQTTTTTTTRQLHPT